MTIALLVAWCLGCRLDSCRWGTTQRTATYTVVTQHVIDDARDDGQGVGCQAYYQLLCNLFILRHLLLGNYLVYLFTFKELGRGQWSLVASKHACLCLATHIATRVERTETVEVRVDPNFSKSLICREYEPFAISLQIALAAPTKMLE